MRIPIFNSYGVNLVRTELAQALLHFGPDICNKARYQDTVKEARHPFSHLCFADRALSACSGVLNESIHALDLLRLSQLLRIIARPFADSRKRTGAP